MSTPNIENQNSEMPSSFFDDVQEQNKEESPVFLGKYQVIRELGQGGMGKVYLCHDNVLQRHVAIKVILSQYKERAKKRFLIEAQSIANLSHPNIIKIYELGFTSSGNPYMVMEYVAGESLKAFVARKSLSLREKVALIMPIADALVHAHRKGVIHRDVKPSNILIDTHNNKNYLMDFGLAKMANTHQDLTKTGSVLGSPKYMSPEQARGRSREIDMQTDIYSLGVTLFEILSGKCPVEGSSSMEVVINVMHKNIPMLRKVLPEASRDLETICLKALQKNKNKRYSHMVQFQNDLKLFYKDKPIRAQRLHLHSWGIWVATLIVILSAVVTYYSFSTSQKQKVIVINDTQMQIEHCLQQQLYQKTQSLLQKAWTQKQIFKEAYDFYRMRIYSGKGQQQKFYTIYNRLGEKQKLNPQLLLARACINIKKSEWQEAQQALDSISSQKLARRDYALKLFYHLQIENSKKDIAHNKVLQWCLELENLNHVLLTHEKLQVYTFLAKEILYFAPNQSDENKAAAYEDVIKYAKKSIAIKESVPMYLCLAKAYHTKGDYTKLMTILSRISQLDRLNQEMFSYYTRLVTIDFMRYKSLFFEIIASFSDYTFALPNPKQNFIVNAATTWPIKPKSISNNIDIIHSLISRFPMQQAKEGLVLERYHPQIEKILEEILAKNKSKNALSILKFIKRLKAIDRDQWINGLIYELNKKVTNAKVIADLQEYLEVDEQQLIALFIEIVENRNTPTLKRYMATKALFSLSQFSTIAQYVNSDDEELKLIATIILRDLGFNIGQKNFSLQFQQSSFANDNHFLQYLLTTIYLHQGCPSDFVKLTMQHGQPINKVYIASFCIKHKEKSSNLYQWAYEFLKSKTRKGTPLNVRSLAYYFYLIHQTEISVKTREELQKTLMNKDELREIKLIILKAIIDITNSKESGNNFILANQNLWKSCIKANSHSLVHTLGLRLFSNENLQNYAKNRDNNYWLRGYAYYLRLKRLRSDIQPKDLKQIANSLKKLSLQPEYIRHAFIQDEPNVLMRGYAYMLLGLMGKEPLQYLFQEDNALAKSYVLLSSTAPVFPFVTVQTYPRKKRIAQIKKYILSENKIVKSSSSYAYGYVGKRFPDNDTGANKRSLAAGLFAHIEREKNEQALLWQYHNPYFDKQIFRYYTLEKFRSRARNRGKEYIKYLQKLIDLDPAKADYYFYLGITYKEQNKWELAQKFLRTALQKKQDIFILRELLLCLCSQQQKSSSPQIDAVFESLLHTLKQQPTPGLVLLSLVKIQNPGVEKILQQNFTSTLLRQDQHKTKHLVVALQMLRNFHKKNNKGFKKFDTYLGWLK